MIRIKNFWPEKLRNLRLWNQIQIQPRKCAEVVQFGRKLIKMFTRVCVYF